MILTSPIVVSAFLMGLFGGVHCVAMCGGVVSVLCSAAPRCATALSARAGSDGAQGGPGAVSSPWRRASYALAYNGGRVASYAALGALFGALGSLSTGVFPLDAFRFGLRAIAALCMLAVGLHLAGLPSIVKRLESLGAPLWRGLAPLAKRFVPLRTPWHALGLGAVWGLMPCGLLYGSLALAASSGSATLGAATMLAFGVATLPVMLTMSAIAQTLSRLMSRVWLRRAAGAVVLAFGLWSTAGVAAQTGAAAAFGLSAGPHSCCPKR